MLACDLQRHIGESNSVTSIPPLRESRAHAGRAAREIERPADAKIGIEGGDPAPRARAGVTFGGVAFVPPVRRRRRTWLVPAVCKGRTPASVEIAGGVHSGALSSSCASAWCGSSSNACARRRRPLHLSPASVQSRPERTNAVALLIGAGFFISAPRGQCLARSRLAERIRASRLRTRFWRSGSHCRAPPRAIAGGARIVRVSVRCARGRYSTWRGRGCAALGCVDGCRSTASASVRRPSAIIASARSAVTSASVERSSMRARADRSPRPDRSRCGSSRSPARTRSLNRSLSSRAESTAVQ